MKKSITKRFKMTKNGKVLHRTLGQCHFRSKLTSNQARRKNGFSPAAHAITKKIYKKPGTL
jgi:ribosomal protein L35